MRSISVILLLFILAIATDAAAQRQIVILKNEKVLHRFYPGDEIAFTLKKAPRDVQRSYVNNIFDTALLVHDQVVAFHNIERIYFQRHTLWSDAGPKLIVAGVAIFLIDQLNTVVVQDEPASIDKGVAITSAAITGAGIAMTLTKKKYQKIGGKYRLRMVEEGSPFYRPDLRVDISGSNWFTAKITFIEKFPVKMWYWPYYNIFAA